MEVEYVLSSTYKKSMDNQDEVLHSTSCIYPFQYYILSEGVVHTESLLWDYNRNVY